MVKRTLSKEQYVVTAFLTLVVFLLGISLGMILSNERMKWAEETVRDQEVTFQSLQFQYLYLDSIEEDNNSCVVLHASLEDALSVLGFSLDTFLEYKKQMKIQRDTNNAVERRYLLDNLRYWLLAKRAKKACGLDLVNILYFYSENECDICPDQGVILTYFKKKFEENLLIFPINADLQENEPMIEILLKQYNVTTFPSIVIEETKFEDVIGKNTLGSILCELYKNNL